MTSQSQTRRARSERGYVLLTLLLVMALIAISAAIIVPTIKFEMQRDREEEMIHRGVQYSRAIRAYYKKFGRYPVKLEDLESTNNLRFLRKRYKDPLNCKEGKCQDFKLLHFGEVQMTLSALSGGNIAGAVPISAMSGSNNSPGGLGQSSAFGQSSSIGQSSTFGPSTIGGNGGFGGNNGYGGNNGLGNANSGFGTTSSGSTGQQGSTQTPGTDATDASTQVAGAPGTTSNDSSSGSQQIIGGPIVGVASATKITDSTIREFNHKKKYKDWVFVYDPAQDQGRLITTPYQPQLQSFAQANLNGQNGSNGTNGTNNGFGSGNGFGNNTLGNSPNGMQNNPTPQGPGYGNPGQPNNPEQPPQ